MTDKKNNLIWIDMEMTGLNPVKDKVIELATIVTDSQLNILAYGPELVIHQSNDILNAMDDWNTNQHTSSGLYSLVQQSNLHEAEAELLTIEFLQKYVEPGYSPICGNSICQDRRFLAQHMPKLEGFFHYRNLDVSTLKILAKAWAPEVFAQFNKESNHRAKDDIIGSITELKFYREHFLKL